MQCGKRKKWESHLFWLESISSVIVIILIISHIRLNGVLRSQAKLKLARQLRLVLRELQQWLASLISLSPAAHRESAYHPQNLQRQDPQNPSHIHHCHNANFPPNLLHPLLHQNHIHRLLSLILRVAGNLFWLVEIRVCVFAVSGGLLFVCWPCGVQPHVKEIGSLLVIYV